MRDNAFSIAGPRTSARMTSPGPPPLGVSSTFLCFPMPKSRRLIVDKVQTLCCKAFPVRLKARTPGNASGNKVMICTFHAPFITSLLVISDVGFSDKLILLSPWDFGCFTMLNSRQQPIGWISYNAPSRDVYRGDCFFGKRDQYTRFQIYSMNLQKISGAMV